MSKKKVVKRIEKEGKFYRMRRGKLVEIPKEWLGQITTKKTKRQRPSKAIHKLRKRIKHIGRKNYKEQRLNDSSAEKFQDVSEDTTDQQSPSLGYLQSLSGGLGGGYKPRDI